MMCMGGIGHTLSICLDTCGVGVWLGVAALMSCTNPCMFCCISCHFAFGGRSVTLVMDHGTMFRLMFALIKATQAATQDEGGDEADVCALCC